MNDLVTAALVVGAIVLISRNRQPNPMGPKYWYMTNDMAGNPCPRGYRGTNWECPSPVRWGYASGPSSPMRGVPLVRGY